MLLMGILAHRICLLTLCALPAGSLAEPDLRESSSGLSYAVSRVVSEYADPIASPGWQVPAEYADLLPSAKVMARRKADADKFVKLLPVSRRPEFQLYLALKESDSFTGISARNHDLPTDIDYIKLVSPGRRSEFTKFLKDVNADLQSASADLRHPAPAPVLELPALVEKVKSSIVSIRAGSSSGTGFLVDGYVYTCAHVIAGAQHIEFENKYGVHGTADRVISLDANRDSAILYSGDFAHSLAFGGKSIAIGSQIVVVGDPLGLSETVTSGIVSAERNISGSKSLQISAAVGLGSSGSPVLDMRGAVVGMVQSRLSEEHAYAFALDVSELKTGLGGVALSDLSPKGRNISNLAGSIWVPDEVRLWNSKYRKWASAALVALQNIDSARLGNASHELLDAMRYFLSAKVKLAGKHLERADQMDASPDCVLYWFRALEDLESISHGLDSLSKEFAAIGWTGVPSPEDLAAMTNLCTDATGLQSEISLKVYDFLKSACPLKR